MVYSIQDIIKAYNILVYGIESEALENEDRSYGGIIRASKGKLVESIAQHMVRISWNNLKADLSRLSFEKKQIKVPINLSYLDRIEFKEVRDHILNNLDEYYYGLKTDIHVSIDNKLVMAIECKAYTENAMLKRILVDFSLMKNVFPNLDFVLIQLESQLTGDYSEPSKKIIFGSPSTHTLLSYFDVDLHIITLLEGERKVDEPIHKPGHHKELKRKVLIKGINQISKLLQKYI